MMMLEGNRSLRHNLDLDTHRYIRFRGMRRPVRYKLSRWDLNWAKSQDRQNRGEKLEVLHGPVRIFLDHVESQRLKEYALATS